MEMLQNNNSGQLTAWAMDNGAGPCPRGQRRATPCMGCYHADNARRRQGGTMIPLTDFNQLPADEAAHLLKPCVAIDAG